MKSRVLKNSNEDWHPNIWPPFTQISCSKPQIEVTHGKDALIFTKNPEQELIDGISSWWVTLHGHSNDYIANAISHQAKTLEQVIFGGLTTVVDGSQSTVLDVADVYEPDEGLESACLY